MTGRSIWAAFKSSWSLITMLLSAFGVFSFVVRAFDLTLGDLLSEIVTTYRAIFHPILEFLASPLPWTLSGWQKDLLLIYLAIGGATSRTYWNEFAKNNGIRRDPDSITRSDHWESLRLAVVSMLLWPVTWLSVFSRPYYYVHKRRDGRPLFVGRWHVDPTSEDHEVIYDMRVVLLTQLLAVGSVVGVLTVLTVLGVH